MIDPKLLVFLRGRVEKCPLCKWTLEDLELHGQLTKDYPHNQNLSSPLFPLDAKTKHLALEGVRLLDGLESVQTPVDRGQEGSPGEGDPSSQAPEFEKLW